MTSTAEAKSISVDVLPLVVPEPAVEEPLTPGARRTVLKQQQMRANTAHIRTRRRKFGRHLVILILGVVLSLPILIGDHGRVALNNADALAATWCNLIGDIAFAISGAVTAGEAGMDLVGCMMMGFVTALGGGSIRDTVLGITPLFWLTQGTEIAVTMGVAAATFFAWGPLTRSRFHVSSDDEWLFWIDSLGLGVFAVNGANTAHGTIPHLRGVHFGGAMFCGLCTACFGGLVRDLCCQNRVRILFAEKELYALPALAGAATHLGFLYCSDSTWVLEGLCAGTWVTMAIRVVAVDNFMLMPTFSSNWLNARNPLDSKRRARKKSLGRGGATGGSPAYRAANNNNANASNNKLRAKASSSAMGSTSTEPLLLRSGRAASLDR